VIEQILLNSNDLFIDCKNNNNNRSRNNSQSRHQTPEEFLSLDHIIQFLKFANANIASAAGLPQMFNINNNNNHKFKNNNSLSDNNAFLNRVCSTSHYMLINNFNSESIHKMIKKLLHIILNRLFKENLNIFRSNTRNSNSNSEFEAQTTPFKPWGSKMDALLTVLFESFAIDIQVVSQYVNICECTPYNLNFFESCLRRRLECSINTIVLPFFMRFMIEKFSIVDCLAIIPHVLKLIQIMHVHCLDIIEESKLDLQNKKTVKTDNLKSSMYKTYVNWVEKTFENVFEFIACSINLMWKCPSEISPLQLKENLQNCVSLFQFSTSICFNNESNNYCDYANKVLQSKFNKYIENKSTNQIYHTVVDFDYFAWSLLHKQIFFALQLDSFSVHKNVLSCSIIDVNKKHDEIDNEFKSQVEVKNSEYTLNTPKKIFRDSIVIFSSNFLSTNNNDDETFVSCSSEMYFFDAILHDTILITLNKFAKVSFWSSFGLFGKKFKRNNEDVFYKLTDDFFNTSLGKNRFQYVLLNISTNTIKTEKCFGDVLQNHNTNLEFATLMWQKENAITKLRIVLFCIALRNGGFESEVNVVINNFDLENVVAKDVSGIHYYNAFSLNLQNNLYFEQLVTIWIASYFLCVSFVDFASVYSSDENVKVLSGFYEKALTMLKTWRTLKSAVFPTCLSFFVDDGYVPTLLKRFRLNNTDLSIEKVDDENENITENIVFKKFHYLIKYFNHYSKCNDASSVPLQFVDLVFTASTLKTHKNIFVEENADNEELRDKKTYFIAIYNCFVSEVPLSEFQFLSAWESICLKNSCAALHLLLYALKQMDSFNTMLKYFSTCLEIFADSLDLTTALLSTEENDFVKANLFGRLVVDRQVDVEAFLDTKYLNSTSSINRKNNPPPILVENNTLLQELTPKPKNAFLLATKLDVSKNTNCNNSNLTIQELTKNALCNIDSFLTTRIISLDAELYLINKKSSDENDDTQLENNKYKESIIYKLNKDNSELLPNLLLFLKISIAHISKMFSMHFFCSAICSFMEAFHKITDSIHLWTNNASNMYLAINHIKNENRSKIFNRDTVYFDLIKLLKIYNSCINSFSFVYRNYNHYNQILIAHKSFATRNSLTTSQPLQTLVNTVNPLMELIKSQMKKLQKHATFCSESGLQFLAPSIKSIEHCSPVVANNLIAPYGNFTLGFWFFLPSIECLLSKSNLRADENKSENIQKADFRIHLISRIAEASDVNVVSLVSLDTAVPPNNSSFNICLHVVDKEAFLEVEVLVGHFDIQNNASSGASIRKKVWNKQFFKSNKLISNKWTSCIFEMTQELKTTENQLHNTKRKTDFNDVEEEHVATLENSSKNDFANQKMEFTNSILYIDGKQVQKLETLGGKSMSYQSIIIGKIPTQLVKHHSIDSAIKTSSKKHNSYSDYALSSSTFLEKCSDEIVNETDFLIADVFWIPSSVYLEASVHKSYIQTFKCHDVEHAEDFFFTDFLPLEFPPSLFVDVIDDSFDCCSRIMNSIATVLITYSDPAFKQSRKIDSKEDIYIEQFNVSILHQILLIFDFALDAICFCGGKTQTVAFKILVSILKIFASNSFLYNQENKNSDSFAMQTSLHERSVVHIKNGLNFILKLVGDLLSVGKDVKIMDKYKNTYLFWLKRFYYSRNSLEKNIRLNQWNTSRLSIEEGTVVSGVAEVFANAMHIGFMDEHSLASLNAFCNNNNNVENFESGSKSNTNIDILKKSRLNFLILLICGGGWAPNAGINKTVDLLPRKIFMAGDPKGFEQAAFTSTATVMQQIQLLNSNKSASSVGLWLKNATGSFVRLENNYSLKFAIPRGFGYALPATELIAAQDCFSLIEISHMYDSIENFTLRTANELIGLLKAVVYLPVKHQSQAKLLQQQKLQKALKRNINKNNLKSELKGSSDNDELTSPSEIFLNHETSSRSSYAVDNYEYLELMQEMLFLRLLLVQITILTSKSTETPEELLRNFKKSSNNTTNSFQSDYDSHLKIIRNIVSKILPKLMSIAVMDPVHAVSFALSDDAFKGVQIDVLKNLLKEGDSTFLEKISFRLWKQFNVDNSLPKTLLFKSNTTNDMVVNSIDYLHTYNATLLNKLIHITALGGEVVVSDTKVRALTHFPSIRLLGISLERMSGRWFYECTILSEGLMQIGWANAHFRCDPINGQGVGDHMHSWAFDGLRSKKWNVSCEPYGKRWHNGDTVGALIDMDLMEMRFYLNGRIT
jgi:hypothetical protein